MLIQLAALAALVLVAAVISPLHAMALICACAMLVVYPLQSLAAIAITAAAYLFITHLPRRKRNGIRRLHRFRDR